MKKVTSLQGLQVEGENARENGKYVPLSPESGILLKLLIAKIKVR